MDKFVIHHIPKTAGQSLQKAFRDVPQIDIYPYHCFIDKVIQKFPDSKIISTVRNPFSRVWSQYNFYRPPIRMVIPSDQSFEEFVLSYKDYDRADGGLTCFWSCWDFVSVDGEIKSDVVFKFETLSSDFTAFCKQHKLTDNSSGDLLQLPHVNKNRSKQSIDVREVYNDTMIRCMNDYFSKDIETWGYSYKSWLEAELKHHYLFKQCHQY